ncbi:MAG: hypothetical protein ACUVRK_07745 [Spirochaetota bacterium]
MKRLFRILLSIYFYQYSVVFSQSPKEIIEKSDVAIRDNTSKSTVAITIKTRRWERTLKLVSCYDLKYYYIHDITKLKLPI